MPWLFLKTGWLSCRWRLQEFFSIDLGIEFFFWIWKNFSGDLMEEFFWNDVCGITESSNEQSYQFVADQLGASWKAILFTGTQPAKRPSKYPCDPLNSLPPCCFPIRIIMRGNSLLASHLFKITPFTRCLLTGNSDFT